MSASTLRAKFAGTLSTKVAVFVLGGATSVVISRVLRPEGRGAYYVLVTAATTAAALGNISVEQAHVYLWWRGSDRPTLYGNAVALGLINGTVAAAATWAIVISLGESRVPVASYALFVIALAAVPATLVVQYLRNLLTLGDRIGSVNVSFVFAASAQSLVLLLLARWRLLTVGSVVLVWTISNVLPLLVLLRATSDLRANGVRVSLALARRTAALGLRYHGGVVAVFLLYRVDVFILNAMVPTAQVGLYSLAVTLAELAYLFTDSTAQVALPRQVGSSTADAARNTARVAGANFVLAVAVVACIAVTSPMLVPLVFGRPFSGSVAPLLALGPGVVALAVIRPLGAFLIRLDRPFVYSGASILGLVVNVALNLAFIPRWGIVGSAVASSIPYVMLATFHVGWFKRSSKVEVRHFLPHVS